MADKDGDISKLEDQVDELTKALDVAVEASQTAGKAEVEALAKQVTELTEKLEKAEAEKAELTLKASMTPDEKDHCSNMKDDEKKAFFAKSPEDRKAAMKKKLDNDEMIKVEGQEIRKSVVGDAQFNIFKAQDARIKKQDEDIAKERDAREMSELSKRADDEFAHVPGNTQERAAMLKAMTSMDETVRKSFEAVLTQSEKLAKASFDTVGNKGGTEDLEKGRKDKNGISDFEKKCEEIRKSHKGMSRSDAMSKARLDYPKEFEAYNKVDSN